MTSLIRHLWGEGARTRTLLLLAAVLLFIMLGAGQLWTHEGRWAAICQEMKRSGDYLHPRLGNEPYYDKPLFSYWLMLAFSIVLGGLNEWALRIPSALAGVLSVWCTYRVGLKLFSRGVGLLTGAMLATCILFVFWSRVASADALNLAGTIAAVAWYFHRKEKPGFSTYSIFFLILAVSSHFKGLSAPAVALLAILPDLLSRNFWKVHVRPSFFLAMILGAAIYVAPFFLSSLQAPEGYTESGLKMAMRENFVRYFHPWDHEEPFYIYFEYLPLYLLPWTPFLPFALWRLARDWKSLTPSSRWTVWSSFLIFVFLTASGSRRPYYILPILPFTLLMIADWFCAAGTEGKRPILAGWVAVLSWLGMIAWFGFGVPYISSIGGTRVFVEEMRKPAESKAPLRDWTLVVWNTQPIVGFYCQDAAGIRTFDTDHLDDAREFLARHPYSIVITTRKHYEQGRAFRAPTTEIWERSRIPAFVKTPLPDEEDLVALIP